MDGLTRVTQYHIIKSHLPHHLDQLIFPNNAAHILIALIVAVHYAVKQGDKGSVKSLLDSLTPEQQLQFLSTKDKKIKTAILLLNVLPLMNVKRWTKC